jgi:hypothetical protein
MTTFESASIRHQPSNYVIQVMIEPRCGGEGQDEARPGFRFRGIAQDEARGGHQGLAKALLERERSVANEPNTSS